MGNEFWMFVVNVACHWGSLLTSGVIAVAVMIVEHWINRNITWRNFSLIMGLGLFVSCFLAWHDEHSNAEVLKVEKSDLTNQRGILQAKLDAAQSQINQLLSQLSGRPPIITTTIPRSWSLSEQQQHEFRNQLEGTKAAFIVVANMGNEQSVRFGTQIITLLKSVGWTQPKGQEEVQVGAEYPPFDGIMLTISPADSPDFQPAAKLQAFLDSLRLSRSRQPDICGEVPVFPKGMIKITIGFEPATWN